MDKLFKELSEQASIESHQRGYDQPLLYRKLILGPGVIGEDGVKGEAGTEELEQIRIKYLMFQFILKAEEESKRKYFGKHKQYRKLILGPGVIGEDGIKGEAGSFALEAIRHKYNSAVKALEGPSTWYGGRTKRRVTKRARHSRRYISEPIHATPPNFGIPKSGRRKNSKRIGRR